MKCKNCGAEIYGNQCSYCGTSIQAGTETTKMNVTTKNEKAKKPIYKKWWFWLIVVLIVIGIAGSFGDDTSSQEASEFNWNNISLGIMIPEPNSNLGKNLINDINYLSIDVVNISIDDFNEYVNECREKGFTNDVSETDVYFNASNAEGYSLMLYYTESDEELSIDLTAPAQTEENTDNSSNQVTSDKIDESERTYEVVRKFVELYNERLEPDIINTKEYITEDRILRYDEAFAIQGEIGSNYILVMNCGPWEIKDEMRIEMYAETPEEVLEIISNVSIAIGKPLTEEELNTTKQYLNECFTDEYQKYTEWTGVNSISYWSGYNGVGDNYEVLIEFSIDKFYK